MFNNSGNVDIQAGTLRFTNGGTHTGDFSGVTGTTLEFGGNHSFSAGSDVTGGFNVLVSSGSSTDNGLINTTGNLTFQGGTITIGGTVSASGINFTGGTATFNNTTAAKTMSLSSGTLGGTGTSHSPVLRPGPAGRFQGTARHRWVIGNVGN